MQNNVAPIVVKKEGVSDDSYKVIELYTQNGSWVEKGELILCFETSKTAIDIESPRKGYVFFDTNEEDVIMIGQTIAVISDEKNFSYRDWFDFINGAKEKISLEKPTLKISKAAQRIIDEINIDISVFKGSKMITREDVENHLLSLRAITKINNTISIDKNSVLIFGGGGHAKMCIDIIKQTRTHSIAGIVDDNIPVQTEVLGIPVIGNTSTIELLINKGLQFAVLGVGGVLNKGLRKKIFLSLKKMNLHIPNIIHPSSSVESSATLGEGNQIMQGAIVGSNVQIGNNCIINSGSIISHDTVIGNNVHIAPGAIIAGGVIIKDDTIIGMGCTIFLGVTIGENVVIPNGVNIFKDISDNEIIKTTLN